VEDRAKRINVLPMNWITEPTDLKIKGEFHPKPYVGDVGMWDVGCGLGGDEGGGRRGRGWVWDVGIGGGLDWDGEELDGGAVDCKMARLRWIGGGL